MAKPFNTWAFLHARGFLTNYAALRLHNRIWRQLTRFAPFFGPPIEGKIPKNEKEIDMAMWRSMRDECDKMELVASVASIDRMLSYLDEEDAEYDRYWKIGEELEGRLLDELQNRTFLSLTLRETKYFEKPRIGWDEVITRFGNAVGDIEEAGKCFALSRYAAAVFHSLQVVELGVIELGKIVGVDDHLPGWTATTQALKKIMNTKHQDRTSFHQQYFKFLEQIHGTVEGLNNAWRNKISHANNKLVLLTADFSPDVAEEILLATRAFMRRLADGLPPPAGQD